MLCYLPMLCNLSCPPTMLCNLSCQPTTQVCIPFASLSRFATLSLQIPTSRIAIPTCLDRRKILKTEHTPRMPVPMPMYVRMNMIGAPSRRRPCRCGMHLTRMLPQRHGRSPRCRRNRHACTNLPLREIISIQIYGLGSMYGDITCIIARYVCAFARHAARLPAYERPPNHFCRRFAPPL